MIRFVERPRKERDRGGKRGEFGSVIIVKPSIRTSVHQTYATSESVSES